MLNNLSPNQHMLSCPALSSWDHKMWRSAPCWWRCALQEAATQSEAVSPEAPRRSCSWTGAASRETPRGTPAATRVTRTWRTVMTAWVACEHCPAPLPHPSLEKRLVWSSVLSRCSSIPSRQNFSFPCSPGQTLLSSHLLPGALFLFSPRASSSSSHPLICFCIIEPNCHFFVRSVLLRASLAFLHKQTGITHTRLSVIMGLESSLASC